jgi:hypothetical protein
MDSRYVVPALALALSLILGACASARNRSGTKAGASYHRF